MTQVEECLLIECKTNSNPVLKKKKRAWMAAYTTWKAKAEGSLEPGCQ